MYQLVFMLKALLLTGGVIVFCWLLVKLENRNKKHAK